MRNAEVLSETTRLEAFSDGVFAIAITLLILVMTLVVHLALAMYFILPPSSFRASARNLGGGPHE